MGSSELGNGALTGASAPQKAPGARKRGPRRPRPPVRRLESAADAAALASWAAVQAAKGAIGPQQANSVANLCREWRRSHDAGAEGRRYGAAVDFLGALLRNKHVRAAVEGADHDLVAAYRRWVEARGGRTEPQLATLDADELNIGGGDGEQARQTGEAGD